MWVSKKEKNYGVLKSSSYLKFPSWKDFKKGKGTIRPLVQTLDSEVMVVVILPLSLDMTMRCELVRHLLTMGLLLTFLNIKFWLDYNKWRKEDYTWLCRARLFRMWLSNKWMLNSMDLQFYMINEDWRGLRLFCWRDKIDCYNVLHRHFMVSRGYEIIVYINIGVIKGLFELSHEVNDGTDGGWKWYVKV